MRGLWNGKLAMFFLVSLLVFSTMAGTVMAEDLKHYGVRLRGLAVIPNPTVDSRLDNLEIEAKMAVAPELDLEYFFTRNLSSELILGVTKHDLVAKGQSLGSTWLLPPTLTLKYHPIPASKVSPYVGFGLNYVIPFNDKADGVVNVSDFHISSSLGWAAQAGVDVPLNNSWYFNVDFKYLNVDTEATINGTRYDLDLNPYIVGTGVAYRF